MKNRNQGLLSRGGTAFLAALYCGLFISCQTLQRDLVIASADTAAYEEIEELENRILRMDGAYSRQEAASIRRRIDELERKPVQDAEYKAQLAAWSGRLFLLEDRTAGAEKQLKLSAQLFPGNVQARVLEIRLEKDAERRLAAADRYLEIEALGELYIERGRALLELKRYQEAAAAFDTAFVGLAEVYREVYGPSRTLSWELRDAVNMGNDTAELAQRSTLSWRDLIELTQNETGLFRFLTAGRIWSAEDIFDRLLDRAFIPPAQDVNLTEWPAGKKPLINETVSRSGAAWYLWHLFAENRADRSLLTRYSSRYALRTGALSPVSDIPLKSLYFDSVLGCVEREIMSLPDGDNFVPNENIRGAAFLSMLRKTAR
jgi:tetratricopeptide (TPR) repeat protein